MTTNKHLAPSTGAARLIGALFLIATLAYMLGNGLIESLLAAPGALLYVDAHRAQLVGGALLQLVNCAAVVGISALFFPIVSRQSAPVALGYVGARILEAAFLSCGAIAILALSRAQWGAPPAGSPETSAILTLGAEVAAGRIALYHVAMGALSLGSLPLCYVLYRARIIPRPLAGLGLLGYTTLLIGSCLELFGVDLRLLHNLPGGIFELILPIWLIAKGFNEVQDEG